MTATEEKMTIESSAFLYFTDYLDMIHHFPSEVQRTVSEITELDTRRVRLMDAIQATQKGFARKVDTNSVTDQDEVEYCSRMQGLGAKYLEHTDERLKLVQIIKSRVDCKKKQLEMGMKFTEDLIDKANGLPGNGTSGPKGMMGCSRGDAKTPVKLNKDKDGDSTILIKGTSGSKRGGRRGHGGKGDSSTNSREADLNSGPSKRTAGGKRGGKTGTVHKGESSRGRSGRGSNSNNNNNDNPDSPIVPDYDSSEPLYCHCQRISYGDMIGCDNIKCKYEWFHFDCVGLSNKPKGKWYCPDCRGSTFSRKK